MRIYTQRPDHNTGYYVPYSLRTVNGFFNVPQSYFLKNKACETGPTVYRPYPRRLESLIICRCYYKGSTFSSIYNRKCKQLDSRSFLFITHRKTIKLMFTPAKISSEVDNRYQCKQAKDPYMKWEAVLHETTSRDFFAYEKILMPVCNCRQGKRMAQIL